MTAFEQVRGNAIPTPAERVRQEAVELAAAHNDYYVSLPDFSRPDGPMSERQMRATVDAIVASGRKPLVLKAVEDYGK